MSLSCAVLMEEASQQTGMTDWGDLAFTGPLQLLLRSCQETAELSSPGWRALGKNVLRCLQNRLYLQAYTEAHPEVLRQPIRAPVVVTGLPRTGTTLLHRLLALDPANRPLRFWEALRPVPPDVTNGFSEASLVQEAETWLQRLYERAPGFRAVHDSGAHTPEECDVLFQNAFASWHFEIAFPADEYSDWLQSAELSSEYSYYARQLQALMAAGDRNRRWVLKSPSHLGHLDALWAVLPDATVVHAHRDPLASVASFASLVVTVRTPYVDQASPTAIAQQWLTRFSAAMERALEVRDRSSSRIVDVPYAALVRDPVATVGSIYDRLGQPFDEGAETRIARWLEDNPQHKHGPHRYDLEQFGLTPAQVSAAFEPYCERFAAAIAD